MQQATAYTAAVVVVAAATARAATGITVWVCERQTRCGL